MQKKRGGKGNWWLALGLSFIGAVLVIWFEAPMRLFLKGKSRIAPYPYSLSGGEDVSRTITSLEERIQKLPGEALDRAALSAAYLARARSSGANEDYEKAERLAKESLRSLPISNLGAKMTLARVAEARHEFKKAIGIAREVLSESRKSDALALLATSNLALGELNEASRAADTLVNDRPSLGNHSLRALVLTAQGRDAEAEYEFKRGIAAEDAGELAESTRTRCLLARFYLKRGRISEAEDLIHEALRISPGNHLALNLRGELELARGQFSSAEKYFFEAFSSSRQMIYFRNYGNAKKLKGNIAGAEQTWQEAEKILRKEIGSGGYGHRLELVQLLLDRGKQSDLVEALKLAVEESRNRQSADSLRVLARAEARAEKWKEAREHLLQIARTGIKDADSYALAAQVESALGNQGLAKFYSDYAKTINPHPIP